MTTEIQDEYYRDALSSLEKTISKAEQCTPEEKDRLRREVTGLREMHEKLRKGQVEIVIFGEISTGKSALINALLGEQKAAVDVRGGWTREVWQVPWDGCGYCIPSLADSRVVLVDTPGVNEVGGQDRGDLAKEAAQRADLILFVTDSDLNDVEYAALVTLAALHKPIIVVLNKVDLYSRDQRTRLLEVLRNDRLVDIVPSEQIVTAAGDPREKEYILTAADGTERSEWRRPAVDIADLKELILRVLDKEGLSLLAINAALYASDQSDRIATLRIELRNRQANKVIWSYAVVKSLAVGLNPVPAFDVAGGTAADAALVMTLASVYGLEVTWKHAGELVWSIIMAAGWTSLSVAATSMLLSAAKLIPIKGQLLVAIPQGAAAGYGSYIVGQAAKYYFEHGSSWGNESPKQVVQRILADAERDSVLQNLKEEIGRKLTFNRHAAP